MDAKFTPVRPLISLSLNKSFSQNDCTPFAIIIPFQNATFCFQRISRSLSSWA